MSTATTGIDAVTLEVSDPVATEAFLDAAFGLGTRVAVRAGEAPTTGFRGFTLSLVVSGPATVDGFVESALEAGASVLKPVHKSFWGYGGVVSAPDGTIWKVASGKKDTGPATREVDSLALLLGVSDVRASKQFYVDHGLEVAKSFGGKYVEFAGAGGLTLALYPRKAAAKDAGVSPEGSGSHRIVVHGGAASFTDPDGFTWAPAQT